MPNRGVTEAVVQQHDRLVLRIIDSLTFEIQNKIRLVARAKDNLPARFATCLREASFKFGFAPNTM